MTYKQGQDLIISIFAATRKGYEKDAMIKCTNKIDSLMDSGVITFKTGDRLKSFLFDYKVLVTC